MGLGEASLQLPLPHWVSKDIPHSPTPLPCTGPSGHNSSGPAHRAAPYRARTAPAQRVAGPCRPAFRTPGRPYPARPGMPGPTASRGEGCAPRTLSGPARNPRVFAGKVSRAAGPASRPNSERAPAPRPAPPPRPGPPSQRASERPRHGPAPALAPCTDATAEPAGRNLPGAGAGGRAATVSPLCPQALRSPELWLSPPGRLTRPPPAWPPARPAQQEARGPRFPGRRGRGSRQAAGSRRPLPRPGPRTAPGGRRADRGGGPGGEARPRAWGEPSRPAGDASGRAGVCAAPAPRKRKPLARRPSNFAAGGADRELRGPLPGMVSRPAGGQRHPARCFPGYK